MEKKYGVAEIKKHFADTRDTLCYATNENQEATLALLDQPADFAIVVGGYNSSNTSHIVELCEKKFPTYFISSEKEIISEKKINHFDFHAQQLRSTDNFFPRRTTSDNYPVKIILTSGASCPDAVVERVMMRFLSFFEKKRLPEDVMQEVAAMH